MSPIHITVRLPERKVLYWSSLGGLSLGLHVCVFLAALLLPRLLASSPKFPKVYTVSLVSLPAGPPGPPARGTPAAPAAPPPAPAPVKAEPAVKIPEKPKQTPAPKPKPEKPKETKAPEPKIERPKPPEPKPAATPPPEAAPAENPAGGTGSAAGATAGGDAGAGTPGGIPGAAGGGGGSGYLDDATFEYGWYLSRMTSILRGNWARPFVSSGLGQPLRAVVYFTIRRDGTLANIVLEQASGDATLDRSALRAVQDSNPLPPLPYQYGKDSLGVHFYFELVQD